MTPQEAIETIEPLCLARAADENFECYGDCNDCKDKHARRLEEAKKLAIKALAQTRWIPVKCHRRYVDEYEEYPDEAGVIMIDSPMPAEGEDVLITIKGESGQVWVEKDIALKDEDGWYTDGGYEWVDDIIAWMPLPELYKAESEDKG